jgi:DNA-binding winged helix-turn-helix (wHTH) protein/TolB-like protein/Flp pilus assembly protein TadD
LISLDCSLIYRSLNSPAFLITLMLNHPHRLYEFGPFRLNVSERLLLKHEQPVSLPPKVFELLVILIQKHGRLVEKDELLKEVWPDSFVEESSLSRNIYLLRKALDEDSDDSAYIETVPRHGYRFIADVSEIDNGDAAMIRQQEPGAPLLLLPIEDEAKEEARVDGSAFQQKPSLRAANHLWRSKHTYRVASLAVLLSLSVLLGFWMRGARQQKRNPESAIRSIAVLPFKPLGAEKGNELLGLGMADALIIKLSGLGETDVLPTSAVFKYMNREMDSLAAGRALGVDAILDGTVQRDNEQVRVTAQLIRLSDGKTLWAEKFDGRFDNIFAMQDSISEQLVGALSIKIANDERARLAKRFTQSPEAYQAYLWGWYYWNKRTKEGLNEALVYFQKATEIDAGYALAYAGMADTYCMIVYYRYNSLPSTEIHRRAKLAATRALELDETLAEAHLAIGSVKMQFENDFEGATGEYQRAVELNPHSSLARMRYAWMLVRMRQIDEAVRQAKRGQQLDPLSFANNVALGQILIYARQPDEAVNYFQIARKIEPHITGPLSGVVAFGLGDTYLLKEQYDEAIVQFQELAKDADNRTDALGMLAYTYALAGRQVEAQKVLTELQAATPLPQNSLYHISVTYGALGQKEQAFQWLEKAIMAHQVPPRDLQYDYRLDALRSDQRYAGLLRRHELEGALSQTR